MSTVPFTDQWSTAGGPGDVLDEWGNAAKGHADAVRKARPQFDERADVTIEKLEIVGSSQHSQIVGAIVSGTFEDTMAGAPTLTLDLLDRGYKLLQSGVFTEKPEVTLDGIPFRLTEFAVSDVEQLELTFEHKLVALLREHTKALKANRATTTRAQFVEMMIREVSHVFPVNYVCPEVNVKQPIQGGKQSGRKLVSKTVQGVATSAKVPARSAGFQGSSLTIRTWDGGSAVLGPQQLANARTILQVCAQDQAPPLAVLAIMEAASVEPDTPYGNPGTPGDHSSTGTFQLLPSTAASTGLNPLDVAACAHAFLTRGFGAAAGGAIGMARANPGQSAGAIAQAVENSAHPSRYDAAQSGATTVINAFGGFGSISSGTLGSAGRTTTSITQVIQQKFEFSRGQPGQTEDSWTCMQRLASEVQWRCFVAGRNSLYFVTDDDLLNSRSLYIIHPETPGVGKVTFQVETGGRTIVRKKRRILKPNEGQFDARVKRWQAPPGTVLELEDYGMDGEKWLVSDVQRPLFDRAAQVTFIAPTKPLPEPPNPTTTQTTSSSAGLAGGGSGSPTGSTLSGLVSPFTKRYTANLGNTDMGVDFGRQQGINTGDPILAIGDCYCRSNAQFYVGSINPQALWFEFTPAGKQASGYWGWYIAEEFNPAIGPSGALVKAGTVVGRYAASGTGIEIGWAAGPGLTATKAFHPGEVGGRHGGNGTTDGRNFLAFLQRVRAV